MNFNGTNSMPSSGPGSLHDHDELPPDLPPLPEVVPPFPIHHPMMPPVVAPMQMHPQMMYNTADTRPAPLGGRLSPPHGGGRSGGRYPNRSPSPPPYSNGASGRYRNVSPSPSERSDRSSYSYDEGRYSPPPYPPRHRNRHSRDDRSPDRYVKNVYYFLCLFVYIFTEKYNGFNCLQKRWRKWTKEIGKQSCWK